MIIHFTKSIDIIESILSSKSFKLTYCTEYFGDYKKIISNAAHPMVSFSEYTEDELPQNQITYGNYGIALSKEWAKKNNLNPVLYIEKNTMVAQGLKALLQARQNGEPDLPDELRLPIMQIKCFTKHVTGYNSYLNQDGFCFKNEKEWRYVPTKKDINNNNISIDRSKFLANKQYYNDKLNNFCLKFEINDIEKIFVKNESEVNKITCGFQIKNKIVKIAPWKNIN